MTPRKQAITFNDATSKSVVRGTIPPPVAERRYMFLIIEAAANVRPMPLYVGQILHMLVDMKQMGGATGPIRSRVGDIEASQ